MRISLIIGLLGLTISSIGLGNLTNPDTRPSTQPSASDGASQELSEAIRLQLDWLEKRKLSKEPPEWWRLVEKHGRQLVLTEVYEQARRRPDPDFLLGWLMYGSKDDDPWARDLALRGLGSSDDRFRFSAALWCLRQSSGLEAKVMTQAAQEIRRRFLPDMDSVVFEQFEQKLARPSDLPLIREVYRKRFADELKAAATGSLSAEFYSCARAFHGPISPTRSRFIALMYRLGDAASAAEIRSAITQKDNPQQRMWGIFMAGHLKERRFLPLLAPCLEDRRRSEDWIDEILDPDNKKARMIEMAYTRVCDLAVRAVHEIAPPSSSDPWPFKVPSVREWYLSHGRSRVLEHREELGQDWSDIELWKSDGTAEGTVLVKDIYTDSGSSTPGALTTAIVMALPEMKNPSRPNWWPDRCMEP